jgi:hypothetical protein
MAPPTNSNETYCTFTLASDVTAGGLPSEAEIAKDLESNDDIVRFDTKILIERNRFSLVVNFYLDVDCTWIFFSI